jgi:hypothetical protein
LGYLQQPQYQYKNLEFSGRENTHLKNKSTMFEIKAKGVA